MSHCVVSQRKDKWDSWASRGVEGEKYMKTGKQNGSVENEYEPAHEKGTLCFFYLCFFKCTCAAPYWGYKHTFLSEAFTKSLLHVCKQQSLWQDCATAQACLILCWSLFLPPCKYSSPPTSLLSPTCLSPPPPSTYCKYSSHPTSLLSPVTSFPTPVVNTVTSFLPSFPTCIHTPPPPHLLQVQQSSYLLPFPICLLLLPLYKFRSPLPPPFYLQNTCKSTTG